MCGLSDYGRHQQQKLYNLRKIWIFLFMEFLYSIIKINQIWIKKSSTFKQKLHSSLLVITKIQCKFHKNVQLNMIYKKIQYAKKILILFLLPNHSWFLWLVDNKSQWISGRYHLQNIQYALHKKCIGLGETVAIDTAYF